MGEKEKRGKKGRYEEKGEKQEGKGKKGGEIS